MHKKQQTLAYEGDIRSALLSTFAPGQIVMSEFVYADGKRRADLVSINNAFHAFEIKSDVDSLSRLKGQLEDYLRIFEYISFVTTEKYLSSIISLTPKSIGIKRYYDGVLEDVRKPQRNTKTSRYALLTLLSSRELDIFARVHGYSTSKMDIHSKRLYLSKKIKKPCITNYISDWYMDRNPRRLISAPAPAASDGY